MGGDKRDNLSQECLDSDPPRHVLMELTQLRVTLSPSRPLCRESVCIMAPSFAAAAAAAKC